MLRLARSSAFSLQETFVTSVYKFQVFGSHAQGKTDVSLQYSITKLEVSDRLTADDEPSSTAYFLGM